MQRYTAILRTSLVLGISTMLASCAYLIPPEQNAPRNNTVVGAPRKPQLNPASRSKPRPQASAAATDTVANAAGAMPAAQPMSQERRMPQENQQVAAAGYPPIDSVPPAPPTTGDASAKQHLNDAKAAMEQSRDAAVQAKEKLAKDVAAEPSMLAPVRNDAPAVVNEPLSPLPASVPVNVAPKPAVQAQPVDAKPVAANVADPTSNPAIVVSSNMPQTPVADMILPPPPANAPAAVAEVARPAVVPSVPVAAQQAALAPMPQAEMPPAPIVPAAPAVVQAAPTVVASRPAEVASVFSGDTMTVAARRHPGTGVVVGKGDFDPLAAADEAAQKAGSATAAVPVAKAAAGAYGANGYLAPSRYSETR